MSKEVKKQKEAAEAVVVRLPRKLKKWNKKNFGVLSFDEKDAK
ncbi:hypothetical protein [Pedobacter lusitanus]|nr:hypothetical protein [Pedobacter lusitanus]